MSLRRAKWQLHSVAYLFNACLFRQRIGYVRRRNGDEHKRHGHNRRNDRTTNVDDAQTIKVSLPNVSDGNSTTNLIVPMSILIGDTTGDGTVSSSDVMQVKFQSGQAVTSSNFRADINASGTITSTDVSIVKSKLGTALPAIEAQSPPRSFAPGK